MTAAEQAAGPTAPPSSQRTGTIWLKSMLREPLVHFLLLALVIFAGYRLIGADIQNKPGSIVVTAPKIEQMAILFTKTWQRPPTSEELKGLIDDYVKEEVLVREALALGLDRDDTVVRRRLRQKMEFVDAAADVLTPTDADLQAYLQINAATFEIDPMLAFQQVYLNPQRHGDSTARDAASILEALQANPAADPSLLGDPTLLPSDLPLSSKTAIGQTFGVEFPEKLDKAPLDQWTGPIASSFGLHLVRVSRRMPGRVPALDEVRDAVAREWTNAKRRALEDGRFAELLKHYMVSIEFPVSAEAGR
ncbi:MULTISPECIES: peptidylprolyl isomerase [unclassified Rhizobium]|uniref:peptidylprolyl isomerase n=1 Tax=unclassified Rhizobium TaxID=2613769 RepID=UPI002180B598|nr:MULTISPECIES: peptidylprolyl isomerase [unclassified Rhizobium]